MSKNKERFQNNVNNIIDTVKATEVANREILQSLGNLDLNNAEVKDIADFFKALETNMEKSQGMILGQLAYLKEGYAKSFSNPLIFKLRVEDIEGKVQLADYEFLSLIAQLNPQAFKEQGMANFDYSGIRMTLEGRTGTTIDQLNYLKDLSSFDNYSIAERIVDKISTCLGCIFPGCNTD